MGFNQQRAKLCEFISNRGHDCETTNINALIDKTLNYRENKEIVVNHLGLNRKYRPTEKRASTDYCNFLEEECDVRGRECDKFITFCSKPTKTRSISVANKKHMVKTHTKKCPSPVRAFCDAPHTRHLKNPKYKKKTTSVKRACHKPTHRKCKK
jgi:hypothetical protein